MSRSTLQLLSFLLCCVLSFGLAKQFGSKEDERNDLINLYYATNGDNWIFKDKWIMTGDHCSWEGIECEMTFGHVTGIKMNKNNLTGVLPEMRHLTQLSWLHLEYNHLTGVDINFPKPPQLYYQCHMYGNPIQCPVPDWVLSRCNVTCTNAAPQVEEPPVSSTPLSSTPFSGSPLSSTPSSGSPLSSTPSSGSPLASGQPSTSTQPSQSPLDSTRGPESGTQPVTSSEWLQIAIFIQGFVIIVLLVALIVILIKRKNTNQIAYTALDDH